MKIKRYLVKDMQEAMEVIRRDLGPDAVIISSRKIRQKGWRGWFATPRMEITAAIDEQPSRRGLAEPQNMATDALRQDMAEMKELLRQVAGNQKEDGGDEPQQVQKWRQLLLELDINIEITEDLLQGIAQNTGMDLNNENMLRQTLLTRMAGMMVSNDTSAPLRRIISFIGPTGVGKTTTLAKLAAQFIFFHHKKVALATIDTYRIGAVEQLKIYGQILDVPVEVVMTPEELQQVVDRHQDKDYILIDTTGRPSRNAMQIRELWRFLEAVQPVETYLVLSCTTRGRDLMRIIEDYRLIDYQKLIFTKTDETEALGCILNVARSTNLPVVYITNGQNVPDDIKPVDTYQLAKMILGDTG
ncbi:MAG: flagellar biosynthesis protein FlhF [Bacillota bacterium]